MITTSNAIDIIKNHISDLDSKYDEITSKLLKVIEIQNEQFRRLEEEVEELKRRVKE